MKQLIGALAGWAVSWALGFVPSVLHWLGPVAVLVLAVSLCSLWRRQKRPDLHDFFLFGFIARWLCALCLFHVFQTQYARFRGCPPALAYPLHILVALPEQGSYEAAVRSMTAKAASRGPDEFDPFSGDLMKTSPPGVAYSVGPDLVDNAGALVYDPSNGTISPGDILSATQATKAPTAPHERP